jgi:hypothetical protein
MDPFKKTHEGATANRSSAGLEEEQSWLPGSSRNAPQE